ncbi:MAG: hypothetical protein A3E80_04200, partial [Chlamydiae bacterium RIFCSPHIGHO2_12_FULL_49_9]
MNYFLKILFFSSMAIVAPTALISASGTEAVSEEAAYPVVIIGGGIGGLTSSLYLARAGLEPLVLEGSTPGGLLTQSHSVQNWPGEMEIEGAKLTERVRLQAHANGALFQEAEVVAVDFSKRPFALTVRSLDGSETVQTIKAETCIIATGTRPNFLGIPGEKEYWGKGVTNCAVCDGSLYAGKSVAVVGGGDAAVLEALYLSNIAKDVTVLVRKNSFKGIEEKRIEALRARPNVKILYNTTVQEVKGDGQKISQIVLKGETKRTYSFAVDGLFLAIGSKPNTALFKNVLELDSQGYIVLKKDQETSIEGVYAVGDIVDPVYKQAISAAGDGAKAALQAQQFIGDSSKGIVAKNRSVKQKIEEGLASEVVEISSAAQFEKEIKESKVPVVVDFYATWCRPCKKISPIIESSAGQLNGKIKFLKVNVDKVLDLSNEYQIRSMPTVLM